MYNRSAVFVAACAGMLLFGISLITLGSLAQPLQSRFGLDRYWLGHCFLSFAGGHTGWIPGVRTGLRQVWIQIAFDHRGHEHVYGLPGHGSLFFAFTA